MYFNSEKLKGHYFAHFVYCGDFQNVTPATKEGPLYSPFIVLHPTYSVLPSGIGGLLSQR